MQLKSTIIDTFSRRGYMQHIQITKREFHILMNTLLSLNTTHDHWLFDENLTNEIWRQAEQRMGKEQSHIKTQVVVLTMVDAIQILTNRMIECEERGEELKQKRQTYEFEQNFMLLEPLQKKIDTLKSDSQQFQRDFKMLTEPFMSSQAKLQMKRQSIKRKLPYKQPKAQQTNQPHIDKSKLFQQVMNIHNSLQQKQQEQSLSNNAQLFDPPLLTRTANYKEEKNCAFYLLVFLCVLQVTVCMVKYDFANLIVYIVVYVVVSEDAFLPHLIKLGFGALLVSIVIDGIWLLTYMKSYLHLFTDAAVKKQLKPYFQYVWFVTLLQTVLKLILLYFVKSYEVNFVVEQKDQQYQEVQDDIVIKDAYIPKVRELTKMELAKTTGNK